MLDALRSLLPALFPSWRFFKSVQPSPRLQWRYAEHEDPADWREFRPRPARVSALAMAARLFWNPDWNETLYSVSLSERMMVEPSPRIEDAIFGLIATQIDRQSEAKGIAFRLIFVTRDAAEVTYQSETRSLAECAL